MYEEQQGVRRDGSGKRRASRRRLDVLRDILPEKTPELERYNVTLLSTCRRRTQTAVRVRGIKPKLLRLVPRLRDSKAARPGDSRRRAGGRRWAAYKEKISHSTDSGDFNDPPLGWISCSGTF